MAENSPDELAGLRNIAESVAADHERLFAKGYLAIGAVGPPIAYDLRYVTAGLRQSAAILKDALQRWPQHKDGYAEISTALATIEQTATAMEDTHG